MLQELFGHVVIGDSSDALHHIQRDDINVVACPFPMAAAAMSYVDALELSWDGEFISEIRRRHSSAQSFNTIILATMFFEADEEPLSETLHARLSLLPEAHGKRELAEGLVAAARLYGAQAPGRTRLEIQLKVKYPNASGTWHADNRLDKRCFSTLNVAASGTYGRPNQTVGDWESRRDEYDNDFGAFGKDHMAEAFVIPPRYLAIWKGWIHRRPFIHSEVTSDYSTTPRLVLLIQR